mmetsp:Transcript_15967/g.40940  ORF Transcript_15967/g.40940 Transcript_15967/m.40940 type:complete len:374 (+) Transcript_15967:3382-4503(+)
MRQRWPIFISATCSHGCAATLRLRCRLLSSHSGTLRPKCRTVANPPVRRTSTVWLWSSGSCGTVVWPIVACVRWIFETTSALRACVLSCSPPPPPPPPPMLHSPLRPYPPCRPCLRCPPHRWTPWPPLLLLRPSPIQPPTQLWCAVPSRVFSIDSWSAAGTPIPHSVPLPKRWSQSCRRCANVTHRKPRTRTLGVMIHCGSLCRCRCPKLLRWRNLAPIARESVGSPSSPLCPTPPFPSLRSPSSLLSPPPPPHLLPPRPPLSPLPPLRYDSAATSSPCRARMTSLCPLPHSSTVPHGRPALLSIPPVLTKGRSAMMTVVLQFLWVVTALLVYWLYLRKKNDSSTKPPPSPALFRCHQMLACKHRCLRTPLVI